MTLQSESELIERVFLRIGMAESDEQLENCLGKFLPGVLLKLSSPHQEVREKVMELLVHINKRLKARPQIQLPVEAILAQYQDPQASSFLVNFGLVYLRLGYPRLPTEAQVKLLPNLLHTLPSHPATHQDSILALCVPVFNSVKFPPNKDECKNLFDLTPQIKNIMLPFFLHYLLMPYSHSPGEPIPPGLSPNQWKRLPHDLTGDEIEAGKKGIIKLISSELFSENEIALHLVIGSSDPRHSVTNSAQLELNRISGSIDWNDKNLVSKAFELFLGTTGGKNKQILPDDKCKAVSMRVRLKLFPCLLKSREASMQIPSSIQVTFESLFGADTHNKLQLTALQFVQAICNNCPPSRLALVGPVLFNGLLKVINEFKEDNLKGPAYVAVGLLTSKLPDLITNNMTVYQTFFQNLEECQSDLKMNIQECLSLMGRALKSADFQKNPIVLGMLENLVLSSIEKKEHPQVRQTALYYSHSVFPRSHVPSKYALILACTDSVEDIRKQAIKALLQPEPPGEAEPDFVKLVQYIREKFDIDDTKQEKKIPLLLFPEAFKQMLHYLHHCLLNEAGVPSELRGEDKAHIDHAPYLTVHVHNLLHSGKSDAKEAVFTYLFFLNQLAAFHSVAVDPACIHYLLELICGLPSDLAYPCESYLSHYQTMMISAKEEVRNIGAHLVAAVLYYTDKSDQMASMVQEYPSKVLESKHGYLVCLGYGASYHLANREDETLLPQWVMDGFELIYSELDSPSPILSSGALMALAEMAKSGPLPNPTRKADLVEKLSQIATPQKDSGKMSKRERAVIALGNLCLGDPQYGYNRPLMEKLVSDLTDLVDVDFQFSVGEALTCAILGSAHPLARNRWTTKEADFKPDVPEIKEEDVTWLINEILSKHVGSTKTSRRQAAAIWLLLILKRCGHLEIIHASLPNIQQGFLNLLTDSNEMTQDMASKGLGILYELGNENQKQQLVSFLVETLTTGRRPTMTVTSETKLFEEGMLGKAPGGGTLTTYKELCALATDLNQPDLVYKFLHLANHHSIWNSRKGAAFGFGSIASKAKEQLSQHMGKIVPKMYRYQFDPNMNIRESFSSIWNAVVPDPQKAADTYFHEIMEDLLANLTNSQWRVRESSCLALKEMLRTHPLVEFKNYIVPLWETLFRVRDDIKETVRTAADATLTTLSKMCVKLCESDGAGKGREEVLAMILPCLVTNGLQSPVAEVKAIGLDTLIHISKKAGPLLKPHLPLLIIALLEALSTSEPQVLNYLSVRQESDQAQEKLDSARISAYRSTPMMGAVIHCVQFIDDEVLKELIPRLLDMLRSSVALGTKAGCSQLVVQLATHCPQDVKPYAGKLMSAFLSGLSDRNLAVRKSYASTIGHLVKVAKDSSIEKLLTKLQAWYFEKEDMRLTCGHTLQAIARHSPDKLKDHATKALPLAFFAMNSPDSKNEIQPWEEVWLELTPGTETGIQLYLQEILALCDLGLEDQSWALKKQAAATLALIADKLGAGLQDHAAQLLDGLMRALGGRTWDGKEYLLRAITKIVLKSLSSSKDQEMIGRIAETLLKECKKEKRVYKEEAISSIGDVAHAHGLNIFTSLFDMLKPILDQDPNRSEDDDNDHEDSPELTLSHKLKLRSTCLQSLGKAWPSDIATQELLLSEWCQLLSKLFNTGTWQLQMDVLSAANETLSRLCLIKPESPPDSEISQIINHLEGLITKGLDNKKYSALRIKSLELMLKLLKLLKANNRRTIYVPLAEKLQVSLVPLHDDNTNPQVKEKVNLALELCKECLGPTLPESMEA